jgi:hypothetical protein
MLVNHLVDRAGRHVARDQVAVLGIPLFQEIPALIGRNTLGIAFVSLLLGDPHTAAFSARRLRHQAQLVLARNRCGVDLNELAIGVVTALLVQRRLR